MDKSNRAPHKAQTHVAGLPAHEPLWRRQCKNFLALARAFPSSSHSITSHTHSPHTCAFLCLTHIEDLTFTSTDTLLHPSTEPSVSTGQHSGYRAAVAKVRSFITGKHLRSPSTRIGAEASSVFTDATPCSRSRVHI